MSISVIIPAYNSEQTILSTIYSVLDQTVQPKEIIVVDDGSNDRTSEIINSISNDSIKYFYQTNQGSSIARNRGIKESSFDYIAFLDADDLWKETFLEEQMEILVSSHKTALVFSSLRNVNMDLKPISSDLWTFSKSVLRNAEYKNYSNNVISFSIPLLSFLLLECPIATPTVIAKKHALESVNFFNPKLRRGQDLDLWLRLSERFLFSWNLNCLVDRRLHENNVTNDNYTIDTAQLKILSKWEDNYPITNDNSQQRQFVERIEKLSYSLARRSFKKGRLISTAKYLIKVMKCRIKRLTRHDAIH